MPPPAFTGLITAIPASRHGPDTSGSTNHRMSDDPIHAATHQGDLPMITHDDLGGDAA